MIWRWLSSLRLTIPLLLVLAVAATFGTLKPGETGRYELFYQTLWFRLLLGLLALNLAVCTVRTLGRQMRWLNGCFEALAPERLAGQSRTLPLTEGDDLGACAQGLERLGYRVRQEPVGLVAHRGLWGRWGATVVHLSLLLIMAGALLGGAGFVGTQQLYVGHAAQSYFDWGVEQDQPLDFEFRLDHFEPIYYPIHLRFVVHEAGSGRFLGSLTAQEGDTVPLPMPGYSARIEKFIPIEKRMILSLYREGVLLGPYDAFPLGNREPSAPAYGMTIHPDAFKDPLLKQMRSEVSILEGGQVVKQGVIEVNHPLVHRGVTIYQTAFDQDQFGFWFAGFQLSRDPGEPLVWFGCVSLVLGFVLAFAVRPQVLGVAENDGRMYLVPLRGFAGDRGVQAFERLGRQLQS